jgi:hypothetical protein
MSRDAALPPHEANLDATKAFLAAFDEYRELCREWIGWAPVDDQDDRQRHPTIYEEWHALVKHLRTNDPGRWKAWTNKCELAASRAKSISEKLKLNVPSVIRLVNGDGGDSRQVLAWFNAWKEDREKEPWNRVATPDEVRARFRNGALDFEELFAPAVPEIDEDVRVIIDHAVIMLASQGDGDVSKTKDPLLTTPNQAEGREEYEHPGLPPAPIEPPTGGSGGLKQPPTRLDATFATLAETWFIDNGVPIPDELKTITRRPSPLDKLGSPATPLQLAIWKALDAQSLNKAKLAKACGVDEVRVYYTNRKKKTGGLTELQAKGIVEHKYGIGYYRPDSPPPTE